MNYNILFLILFFITCPLFILILEQYRKIRNLENDIFDIIQDIEKLKKQK